MAQFAGNVLLLGEEVTSHSIDGVDVDKPVYSSVPVYKMTGDPRGYCAIFVTSTNKIYDTDCTLMRKLFERFKFTVRIHENFKKDEMLQAMRSYSKELGDESHDAFVCIIMSQGSSRNPYSIRTCDDQFLDLNKVFKMFNNLSSHALKERPKMFFIQSSRGTTKDRGVAITQNRLESLDEDDTSLRGGGFQIQFLGNVPRIISDWSDFFISYAVTEGYESESSSYFLRTLYRVFSENSHRMDLQSLMVEVASEMVEGGEEDLIQSPVEIYKGWRKKLFFNPGFTQS